MKAKIRGTEIYFDVAGMKVEPEGNTLIEKPTLFLIHGGPGGNHLHFKSDSIQLQTIAQLVFIDQRGCGWSKKTKTSDYTLENNIEDIEALRKYLGLTKICILGFSYGGMVAQGYAIRYSKHVEKLILAATAPSYHFIEEAKKNLALFGNKKQIEVCEKYLWNGSFNSELDIDHYYKVMNSLYYVTKKRRIKQNKSKSSQSGELKNIFSYEVLNNGFGGFLRHFNFIPKLKKITCPTLILAGQNDWVCTPQLAKVMAHHIPKANLKIFKKCGHIIATDAHDRYIHEIMNFITKKPK